MRRKPPKSTTTAWILLSIYIAGLALGIFLVCYLVSISKRAQLTEMTYGLADKYLSVGVVDPTPLSGRCATVFSPEGQVLYHSEKRAFPVRFGLTAEGAKYAAEVMDGNEVFHLVLFAANDTKLGYTSLLYVGVPIVTDGEITAAFFWVQELRDLLEILLAVLLTFTGVFGVAAAFVLTSQRLQRKYEQLHRQYIDNITHELKTPVASIKALAEALSDGMEKSPNDRNVYYGMIIREANHQERMICDVLELSRLQSYQAPVVKRPVPAAQVFSTVYDKYASLCDLMGISLILSEEVRELPCLYTDENCIQSILDALLSNAIKFVPEGGTIRITAQITRRRVLVCVADTGPGISKEDLPKVFDRFYKGGRSDNQNGSGLGLTIAREAADNLKERLWLESCEGRGTRAYFTISLAR